MTMLKVKKIRETVWPSISMGDVTYPIQRTYDYKVGDEKIHIVGSQLLFYPNDMPDSIQGYFAHFKDLHIPRSVLLTALERGEIAEEEFEIIVSKTKSMPK